MMMSHAYSHVLRNTSKPSTKSDMLDDLPPLESTKSPTDTSFWTGISCSLGIEIEDRPLVLRQSDPTFSTGRSSLLDIEIVEPPRSIFLRQHDPAFGVVGTAPKAAEDAPQIFKSLKFMFGKVADDIEADIMQKIIQHGKEDRKEDEKPSPPKKKRRKQKKRKSQTETKKPRCPKPEKLSYWQPTDLDVLARRGGITNIHPGSQRFLDERDKMQAEYRELDSKNPEKTRMSQELVNAVHRWGGLFLKYEEETGKYYEMTNQQARTKACQALREVRKARKKAEP